MNAEEVNAMRKCAGQSTAEYAILVGVVIAAVVGMQVYMKRGLQAKVAQVADHYTQQGTLTGGGATKLKQYEPYYAFSEMETTVDRDTKVKVQAGYKVDRTFTKDKTDRTGKTETGVDLTQDDAWK